MTRHRDVPWLPEVKALLVGYSDESLLIQQRWRDDAQAKLDARTPSPVTEAPAE